MQTEDLLFKITSPILDVCRRLADRRELVAATLSTIDPRSTGRFRASTARKLAPLYRAILEIVRSRASGEQAAICGVTPELDARLAVLAETPGEAVASEEDPVVAEFFQRISDLDQDLRRQEHRTAASYLYQLVLQFPDAVELEEMDCEDLGDLEDRIGEALGNPDDDPSLPHMVNGNSYGAGSFEIFIDTNDPAAAFEAVRADLEPSDVLDQLVAAYRLHEEEEFTVVWPPGHPGPFIPF